MNQLLVEISNSRTKIALATEDAILERRIHPTSTLDSPRLLQLVAEWGFEKVVLSSVVPEKSPEVFVSFENVIHLDHTIRLGIGIDYPEPETTGADRLANTVAASAIYGHPCVAVDFGSAVTFDVVSADRQFVGGVIAPGLEAMTSYMHEHTSLLPKIDLAEPSDVIGKSTREAMLSGAVFGFRGLVQGILSELEQKLETQFRVVATGGYADWIAPKIAAIDVIDPDLTLHGLRIVGTLN